MVMQALDSYKTLPHASSLQPTTYIVNTMRKQEISAYMLPNNIFCTTEGIRPVKKISDNATQCLKYELAMPLPQLSSTILITEKLYKSMRSQLHQPAAITK